MTCKHFMKISFVSSFFLLASVMPFYTVTANGQPSLTQKEKEIQAQIKKMKEQASQSSTVKEKLTSELNAAQLEIISTQNQIQNIQDSIDALTTEIVEINATIERLEFNIKRLDAEIALTTEKLNKQKHILGQTISFLYETSDVSYIEFLFQGGNLEDLLNTHSFIQLIMDENELVFQNILTIQQELTKQQQELNLSKLSLKAKNTEVNTKLVENEAQKNTLNSLLNAKQQEELALFEKIKTEELRESEAAKSITHYIQQLDYLKLLLSEDPLDLKLSEFDGSIQASKVFVNPLPAYTISSDFGMRFHPVLSYTRMHNGVDLGGVHGEPIYSTANGVVVFAGPAQGFGNWVVIYHGKVNDKDIYSIYGHMESNQISVSNSQRVNQGDVIGFVGNAGTSTGPHLHFGLAEGMVNNSFNYVDPKLYIDFSPPVVTENGSE